MSRSKRAAVGVWVVAAVGLGGLLVLLHDGPLPIPTASAAPRSARWTMTHGLSLKCPCSRRIVDHLVSRGPSADALERVVVADATDEAVERLSWRGFHVERVSSDTLEKAGFVSVPGLVIHRPDGSVAYAGAHAPKRTGPIDDLSLLNAARDGAQLRPFAVLGCAVSQSLSRRVDPLGLKSFFDKEVP